MSASRRPGRPPRREKPGVNEPGTEAAPPPATPEKPAAAAEPSLKDVIAQSKAALHAEAPETLRPIGPASAAAAPEGTDSGPGGPGGVAVEPQGPPPTLVPVLAPAVRSVCAYAANRTGYVGWKVAKPPAPKPGEAKQPDEAEELVLAWDPILAKYLPQLGPMQSAWAAALMATWGFFGPRVMGQIEHQAELEQKEKEAEAARAAAESKTSASTAAPGVPAVTPPSAPNPNGSNKVRVNLESFAPV